MYSRLFLSVISWVKRENSVMGQSVLNMFNVSIRCNHPFSLRLNPQMCQFHMSNTPVLRRTPAAAVTAGMYGHVRLGQGYPPPTVTRYIHIRPCCHPRRWSSIRAVRSLAMRFKGALRSELHGMVQSTKNQQCTEGCTAVGGQR